MQTHRDDFDLGAELSALRPTPSAAFAEELDARTAAGFTGRTRKEKHFLDRIVWALRNARPRRLALPVGAIALSLLVISTAVISIGQTGNHASNERLSLEGPVRSSGRSPGERPRVRESAAGRANEISPSSAAATDVGVPIGGPSSFAGTGHRKVERDAALVLSTEPDEVGEASREVFAAVHSVDGIVLNSSVRDEGDEATARFELLVPSVQLGDALALLSQIAAVSSRRESTLDITAPTVGAGERLEDAQARIDALLSQLASAESESEQAAVEAELRSQRRHAAALRSLLDRLQRRADFARISVRIESSSTRGASNPGHWGVSDAVGDAGHILTIGAGVAVIGLALIAPLALIGLLFWSAHSTWARWRRGRALG